jgi:hypothetical protein
VRLDGNERFAAVDGDLSDAHFALHAVAHDRVRVIRHRAVGDKVVRLVHVHRVDLFRARELHEVDHLGGLGPDLRDVLFRHDDEAAFLEFVALDDLRLRDITLALRAPLLVVDAGLALVVELVERDGRARLGRGIHLDRDVDEADLQIAFPRGARRHGRLQYRPPAAAV